MMEGWRRIRAGRAAPPRGKLCRVTGPATPRPNSPCVGSYTPLGFATASTTALIRHCGERPTSSSQSSASQSSSTAATGMRARNTGRARERTPTTGRPSSSATSLVTPTPRRDYRTPGGLSSASGSTRTPMQWRGPSPRKSEVRIRLTAICGRRPVRGARSGIGRYATEANDAGDGPDRRNAGTVSRVGIVSCHHTQVPNRTRTCAGLAATCGGLRILARDQAS